MYIRNNALLTLDIKYNLPLLNVTHRCPTRGGWDRGVQVEHLTVLSWYVNKALAVTSKMCVFVLPAEQVGVDAGLPSFRNIWKSCQLAFWKAALVGYECDDTIPFSTVKVIVFGCNERIVSGDAS
jgi:hypothetical protein